jgi:hypothetical protein
MFDQLDIVWQCPALICVNYRKKHLKTPTWVVRIRNSKDRQRPIKRDKRTNKDLQNTKQKTKKSLKISNWSAESVKGRMTDNTIGKIKGTINDGQNTTQKMKNGATSTLLNTRCDLRCSRC